MFKLTCQLKVVESVTSRIVFLNYVSTGVKFAMSEENELYLINCPTRDDDAFRVLKAGDYFSVNTKALFDSLGYDYRKNNIMFDMVKEVVDGMEVYKLIKREVPRKKSEL